MLLQWRIWLYCCYRSKAVPCVLMEDVLLVRFVQQCWLVFVWGSLWEGSLGSVQVHCSQHTPRLLGHCLHFMTCLSFLFWLRDRRCWPAGQETSLSVGFGNGLIEVFVWCHTLDNFESVWVFRGKIHVIWMFQKSRLGCTFIIFVEVSPWAFQPICGSRPLP